MVVINEIKREKLLREKIQNQVLEQEAKWRADEIKEKAIEFKQIKEEEKTKAE
jgi:hypothetical protein